MKPTMWYDRPATDPLGKMLELLIHGKPLPSDKADAIVHKLNLETIAILERKP